MPKPTAADRITSALQARYGLTASEATQAAAGLLEHLADCIDHGANIASVHPGPGGALDIRECFVNGPGAEPPLTARFTR